MSEHTSLTKVVATELRDAIYRELDAATADVVKLEQSWMRLGQHLSSFKANEYWRDLGYTTFDDFMAELSKKYHRGRTQLWSYLGVAEKLLPTISATTLEEIGISKAMELKRAMKKSGTDKLPDTVVDAARQRSVTTKELRGIVGTAMNVDTAPDPGSWFDFDGCYMTPEERREFIDIIQCTIALLSLKPEIPDHIKRKEVFLTWAREWFGTHAHDFYGPKTVEAETPATLIMPKEQDVPTESSVG